MRRLTLLLAAGALMLSSCSIKEDRSKCPCWVQIDMSKANCDGLTLTGWADNNRLYLDEIEKPHFNDFYEVTVPRGWTYFSAVANYNGNIADNSISIQKGHQADSLYAHASLLNTNCELAVDKVELHKQFATVHLVMELPEGFTEYPYRVVIRSNTSGWNLQDMSGKTGEFSYEAERIGANEYEFRVPRQNDKSMMIDLYDEDELVDDVKLGELICQSGFDWSDVNLADISLDIRFKESVVLVHISGWSETIVMNVVI